MAIQEDTIREDATSDVETRTRRKPLKPSLLGRVIYDPAVFLFDMLWHAILWVLSFIFVGTILSNYAATALNSIFTKGTISIDDFGSYSLAPQITTHWHWVIGATAILAGVTFVSWRANRIRYPRGGPLAPELAGCYNVAQVSKVNPSPRFISLY